MAFADMRRETIFRTASITKPVTATAVMMLVEKRGRLRLNEPVDRLLSELANQRRRHSTVGQSSPAAFERRAASRAAAPSNGQRRHATKSTSTFVFEDRGIQANPSADQLN